jgi:hypothetical protein
VPTLSSSGDALLSTDAMPGVSNKSTKAWHGLKDCSWRSLLLGWTEREPSNDVHQRGSRGNAPLAVSRFRGSSFSRDCSDVCSFG